MPVHPRPPSPTAIQPNFLRVLVADDDPASCRFLCDALRSLGIHAEACGDGPAALDRARAECFGLLLLDCRMPGAGAAEVLAALREDPHAASAASMAIATSAEFSAGDRRRLLAHGFSDVLHKPCRVADLQRLLTDMQGKLGEALVLDDQAALDSSGDAATMNALRRLLREELAQLTCDLEGWTHAPSSLGERLHRLRSSCGFCGAAVLSRQTVLLQQQLAASGSAAVSLAPFRIALQSTMEALDR